MIQVGDRVKLTDKVLIGINNNRYTKNTLWLHRRGTVIWITRQGFANVKWDGRSSVDQWPIAAVEKAE